MELMTSWERKGRAEGRTEGRAEGELAVIKRLLVRRIGPLSPTALRQLGRLKEPQLEALAEALLDFKTAADLRTWLRKLQQPS